MLGGAHVQHIGAGAVHYYDEFHTLDLTAGFERFDDWSTVYSNNTPSFRKPPLQYWMGALLMEAGVDTTTALRAPSMIFMFGLLIAVVWLSIVIAPQLPWSMPAAVLLCASSLHVWQYALSAMLDIGAALLVVLTLIAILKAVKQPLWWYGVAFLITLGALQKAPVGLVVFWLFLFFYNRTSKLHGGSTADFKKSLHYRRALWLMVAGVLCWPLFQTLLHGSNVIQKLYGRQMIERFAPTGPVVKQRTGTDLYSLIIGSEPLLRFLGIAALAWLPFRLRRADLIPFSLIFVMFVLAMFLANGSVYSRYTLIFLPLLIVVLAIVLVSVFGLRWQWMGVFLAGAISFGVGGAMKSEAELLLQPSEMVVARIAALQVLAADLQSH